MRHWTGFRACSVSLVLLFFLDFAQGERPCDDEALTRHRTRPWRFWPGYSTTTAYTIAAITENTDSESSTTFVQAEETSWQSTVSTTEQSAFPQEASVVQLVNASDSLLTISHAHTANGTQSKPYSSNVEPTLATTSSIQPEQETSQLEPSTLSLEEPKSSIAASPLERTALAVTTTRSRVDICLQTSLSNVDQTGGSSLGLLPQALVSQWLDNGQGLPYLEPPWGNATVFNTDATILRAIPETNVTRRFSLSISRSRISPDGVLRDVILINNQFPGPVIEANWGDWIEVTVTNRISDPEEGTSLHWHGLLQRKSPWQDGVPGVGQCPIAPGQSLTYRFQAEVYGTTWYHAHYSSQYTAGIAGPMIIHGPSAREYDLDLGAVMLSDWNHIPYFSMVANTVGSNLSVIPPRSDSNLINGRGRYNCSVPSYSGSSKWLGSNLQSNISWTCVDNAPTSQFTFVSGKTHRLRLVNHGADGIQKFSIDGHNMTVIASDFVPVIPYETGLVTLAVGQRTDVLVHADQAANSSWWMRTQTPGWPLCGGAVNAEARAAIFYEAADLCVEPESTSPIRTELLCANDPLQQTLPAAAVTPEPHVLIKDIIVSIRINETRQAEWCINNETFRTDFNDPVLFRTAYGQTDFSDHPEWAVYNFDQNQSVVLNVTNQTPFAHPFHLHGHSFFVLNDGLGTWNGSMVHPDNPMRRDVQIVRGSGFAAVQIDLDNPGIWPFHCHVAWHLSGGLNVNLLSHPQDIPPPPDSMLQSCVDWRKWTDDHIVDQIDSGG